MKEQNRKVLSIFLILSIIIIMYANITYALEVSIAPAVENIVVTNNAGLSDTVEVSGIAQGDRVKVYNAGSGGSLLGSASLSGYNSQVTINIRQMGIEAGSIYVSITSMGMAESSRTKADYIAEPKSDPADADNITVTNNAGTSDDIEVTGLSSYDAVKIYSAEKGGRVLGTASVSNGNTSATIKTSQVGASGGSIYVTVTSKYMTESIRTKVDFTAEPQSDAPDESSIIVTNNAKLRDTIEVSDVSQGDIIRVYSLSQGGKSLGSATVGSNKTEQTIYVNQLGTTEGVLYVSISKKGEKESERTKANYSAEPKSDELEEGNISITNNPAGTKDVVKVEELLVGDVIKVYNASASGKLLGTATTANGRTDVSVSITQVGAGLGSVYVTITSVGKSESNRTKCNFEAEIISDPPSLSYITVTNNTGMADTVEIAGLSSSDKVKVYNASEAGKLLGYATVASDSTDVTVSISQIGTTSGSVYITVTSTGSGESGRVKAEYSAEPKTDALSLNSIRITNNPVKTKDTIEVTDLSSFDVVKVYKADTGGKLVGTAVVAENNADVTISVAQLGSSGGSVYISLTSKGELESSRIKVDFPGENKSSGPANGNVKIVNNAGIADTINLFSLSAGDVVKIYDASNGVNVLGAATVAAGSTGVSFSIPQLGTGQGSVYVSITNTKKLESDRVKVDYSAEGTSDILDDKNITVTNNAGMDDKVVVYDLNANDIIKVYSESTGGDFLGTATGSANGSSVTISIPQLGKASGSVYVTVSSKGSKLESARVKAEYPAEGVSNAPLEGNITVVNNSGAPGIVTVKGLMERDVVNIYDASTRGNLLGTGIVPSYGTQVTVSIAQLGTNGASVYVAVTSAGKQESARTTAVYQGKPTSRAPNTLNITVVNNVGIADTATVTDLLPNDVVNIYDAETGGNILGTGTVGANGSQITISIPRLGPTSGDVYVTVTGTGKSESDRTKKGYSSESVSTAPLQGNITIVNSAGMSGTVKVGGLFTNDVVKVYDALTGGNLLNTATMQGTGNKAYITVPELGTSAGSLYVSVTSVGRSESARTQADYIAVSIAPSAGNIVIVNNAGTLDVITISSLNANDAVKVYDSITEGNLLGSGSVTTNTTQVTINISQLTTQAGKVFISITSFGKAESERTEVNYMAEKSTLAPFVGNITIVNNASIADTITVTNLKPYDVVKVYDTTAAGTLLGSATVPANAAQTTVTVTQIGSSGGSLYVSIISTGYTESGATLVDYVAEQKSSAPFVGNITIVNRDGSPDTITLTGLNPYDVIKVYDTATGGNLLGMASVPANGSQAILSVAQLTSSAGNVYISVTGQGKLESDRTSAGYIAE